MEKIELPAGWAWTNLQAVSDTVFGQSPPSSSYNQDGHGLPFFQGKAEFGELNPTARKWCTEPTREAMPGDILLSIRAPVGPTNVADCHCAIGRGLAALRPRIDPKYVRYWLIKSEPDLESKGTGTTFSAISKGVVNSYPIPTAPLFEQLRIVDKVESLFAQLDHGEASLRDVQKLLARYRQSVLKAAVTGQLTADWRAENADRLESGCDLLERILQARRENWQGRGTYKEPVAPDTSNLPELPEGWVWASVDQMVEVFRNGLSKKPVTDKNQYPILRISAVRPMSVSLSDLRYYSPADTEDVSSYWVQKGDLLFTRYSGSAHFVGVCGQMRDVVNVLHPDKLIKVRVIDAPELCKDFLELAWNAGVTRAHIASNIKTTSGQQGIAGGDIKSAPFPLPPADEQEVIAERVWDALEKMERLQTHCQAELTRSAALRQSILKDAFAGKLVPQDPNDEPASELLSRIRAERDADVPKKRTREKVTA